MNTIIIRFIRQLLSALFALSVTAVAATDLPDLGDSSAVAVSQWEERQLGQEFMREARQKLRFVEDPELVAYVNRLGHRLVANSDAPAQAFQFYLVQDPNLNAFAVPGGFISVYTGLVLASESEGELAAVMAHEIAHITQKHMARMLERGKQMSLPGAAAMIGAILLGGQAGAAAVAATNAALIENQLEYSRGFESEADAIGIRTLADAGFDPWAMPAFFKRMEQWGRVQDSSAPEFLRTHPLTPNRIAESSARADEYARALKPDSSGFEHAKAKIRALFSDQPQEIARQFASNLEGGTFQSEYAERFGYALALQRIGQYDQALSEADRLLSKEPTNPSYQLLRAGIFVARGQYVAARELLDEAVKAKPDYGPLVEYYADVLVRTGFAERARPLIRQSIKENPNDPRLWALQARAAGELGETYQAHQALAEYHYLLGETAQALAQLETARRHTGDSFYASASIDARIEELRIEVQREHDRKRR